MLVERKSLISGKVRTMDLPITAEQLNNWLVKRTLAQDAFPNLDPGQREFLMTGITPEEWDEEFPLDPTEELE